MLLAQQPTTAFDLLILAAAGGFLIATLIYVPMLRLQRGTRVAPRKRPGMHRKHTGVATLSDFPHGTGTVERAEAMDGLTTPGEQHSGSTAGEPDGEAASPRTVDHGDLFADRYVGRFDRMQARIDRINAEMEAEPRNL